MRRPRPGVVLRGGGRIVVGGIAASLLVAIAAALAGSSLWGSSMSETEIRRQTQGMTGRSWPSGVWTGGDLSADGARRFGTWRGSPVDVVTTYPAYETWEEIEGSEWHIAVFDGFPARLVYGLPLLPKTEGSLQEVADGQHDDVWRAVATDLKVHGRADSYVRIGLEANGSWFPWGTTADEAHLFVAAYRHVAQVMREVEPGLRLVFDITCGAPLPGGKDRLDALTKLYPGDDVVDVVGCDMYDSYSSRIGDAADAEGVFRPDDAPGLRDLVDFARAHSKPIAVPEWGLTRRTAHGSGDNPAFILAMYRFFSEHAAEVAFEAYFDEPDGYLKSSLRPPGQNPDAATVYCRLW